jgi:hypothetical protein
MYHHFVVIQQNLRVTVIHTIQIITRVLQPFWSKFLQPYENILFNREEDLKLQTKKQTNRFSVSLLTGRRYSSRDELISFVLNGTEMSGCR